VTIATIATRIPNTIPKSGINSAAIELSIDILPVDSHTQQQAQHVLDQAPIHAHRASEQEARDRHDRVFEGV
jgi:hypothetical protein